MVPLHSVSGATLLRALGVRRQGSRQPLHDPDEPDALVLYTPPELSAHGQLKADSYVNLIHLLDKPIE